MSEKPVKDKKEKKAAKAAAAAARERRKQQRLLETRYAEALELGALRMKEKKYSEAVDHFSVAVEINPSDAPSFASRAHCYTLLGDHESALADFSSVIGINPQDDNAYVRRAHARAQRKVRGIPMRSEDSELIFEDLTAAIHLNSCNFAAYAARGDALFDRRERKLALEDYNEAIKINGTYGYGLLRRANCLITLGREAKEEFEKEFQMAWSPVELTQGDDGGTPPRRLRGGAAGVGDGPVVVVGGAKGSHGAAVASLEASGLAARAVTVATAAHDVAVLKLPLLNKAAFVVTAPGLVDRRVLVNADLTPIVRARPGRPEAGAPVTATTGTGAAADAAPTPGDVSARVEVIMQRRAKRAVVRELFESALTSIRTGISSYETKLKDGTITTYAPLTAYCVRGSLLCELMRVSEAKAAFDVVRWE